MADKIEKVPFAHLHLHTEHSVLDGACQPDPLMKMVAGMGMTHVTYTDHGTQSAGYKVQEAAGKVEAIDGKPIRVVHGLEAYFAEDRTLLDRDADGNRYYHLTLLAENDTGLRNLYKMNAEGGRTGFYYKPRVDFELLKQYGEGIIVLSGCMAGRVHQQLINETDKDGKRKYTDDRARLQGARDELLRLMECVGKENVYAELQNAGVSIPGHGSQVQWNAEVSSLAKDLGLLTVGTADTHYLHKSDATPHDAMLCVQTKSLISIPRDQRMSLLPQFYHLRSYREMQESMKAHPECLPTSLLIAERCDARIKTVSENPNLIFERLPKFPLPADFVPPQGDPPAGLEPETWYRQHLLRELAWEGLHMRYGAPLPAEVVERAEFELQVVIEMGVTDYFLIIWDIFRECRERNIPVGPGRGSGAGSILLYALQVTALDPLEYELLFERFLNPDRISMPDVDFDVGVRRKEIMNWTKEKYGAEFTAQIITYSRIGSKAGIRKSAQAMGREYLGLADKMAKLIPTKGTVAASLESALRTRAEIEAIEDEKKKSQASADVSFDLQNMIASNPDARKIIDLAKWLEGMISAESVHPAALVIAPDPVDDLVAVQLDKHGSPVTAYDMKAVEECGLLKLDFLGLRNLDVILEAERLIEKRRARDLGKARKELPDGEEEPVSGYPWQTLDAWKIPTDDAKTYKMLAAGDSIGVFQFECVAGDTIINGEARKTIAELYENPPSSLLSLDLVEGKRRKNKVLKVVELGEKQLYRMVSKSGYTLRATSEHKVLTEGGFREVGELKAGDKVVVNRKDASRIGACTVCFKQMKARGGVCTSCRNRECDSAGTMLTRRDPVKWKAALSRGENHVWWGKPPPATWRSEDLPHPVRSSWEADLCRAFKASDIAYEYEPKSFKLSDGSSYTPDFYLPEFKVWVEMKGLSNTPGGKSKKKVDLFELDYPEETLIRFGAHQLMEFQLENPTLAAWGCPHLPENYEFEEILAVIEDKVEMTYDICMEAPLNNYCANGVIVHNSGGMADALRTVGATEFNDLIAIVALYRPGPMKYIPVYARRKAGREEVPYPDERLRAILGKTYGICVSGDARIQNAETGQVLPLRDVVEQRLSWQVHGVDKEGLPAIGQISEHINSGTKEVVKLTLQSGQELQLTSDHRVYTDAGWKPAGELTPQDLVATPHAMPATHTEASMSKAQLRVLGSLIADGGLTNGPSISFYNSDPDVLAAFATTLNEWPDARLSVVEQLRGVKRYSVVRKDRHDGEGYHAPSKMLTWLRELGLKTPSGGSCTEGGCGSGSKFIPAEVFSQPQELLYEFIAALWDCDGHVGKRIAHYKTISERLAQDLQFMLRQMGVETVRYSSTYTRNEDGKLITAWQVSIYDSLWFNQNILPRLTCKAKQEQGFAASPKGTRINRAMMLKELGEAKGCVSWNTVGRAAQLNIKNLRSVKASTHVHARSLKELPSLYSLPKTKVALQWNWQPVKTVTPAGSVDVYDITVEGTNSFVADGIVVHNCVYQEQSMLISRSLAGFKRGEADTLRKAIGKKNKVLMAKLKPKFIDGCAANKVNVKLAEQLWADNEAAADYSFNKCAHRETIVRLPDGKRISIAEAYKQQPEELLAMWPDGTVRPHRVAKIVSTGRKPCFKVSTESGKIFKGTAEHRLLTTEGYQPIGEMRVGESELITLEDATPQAYAAWKGAPKATPPVSPRTLTQYQSGAHHEMGEWLSEQEVEFETHKVLSSGRVCDFYFAGVYWEMDGLDRSPEYFADKYGELPYVVVTPEDFQSIVAKHLQLEHACNGERIVSITPCGTHSTYDIEMAPDGPLNFIANNLVSHNSHAACYAMISYVTAYLKANFPTEYMSALLSSVMSTKDKVPFYLYETKKMGLQVLPPDVNASFSEFEPEGEGVIRFGMTAVKGVGASIVESITEERERSGPYTDLWDFCRRTEGVSRSVLDALVMAGAFDWTGQSRKGLLEVSESALKQARKIKQKQAEGQSSLFDGLGGDDQMAALELLDAPSISKQEFSRKELFDLERQVTGLYVSGHPLDDHAEAWEATRHAGVGELDDADYLGQTITVAGVITHKKPITTKKDGKRMLVVTLEDLTGTHEIVIFPKLVEQGVEQHLDEGAMAALRVKVELDDRSFASQNVEEGEEPQENAIAVKLLAEAVFPFNPDLVQLASHYQVRLSYRQLKENPELIARARFCRRTRASVRWCCR